MENLKGYINPALHPKYAWYSKIPNYKSILLEVEEDITDSRHYRVVDNTYNKEVICTACPDFENKFSGFEYFIKKVNFKSIEDGHSNQDFKGLLEKEYLKKTE